MMDRMIVAETYRRTDITEQDRLALWRTYGQAILDKVSTLQAMAFMSVRDLMDVLIDMGFELDYSNHAVAYELRHHALWLLVRQREEREWSTS